MTGESGSSLYTGDIDASFRALAESARDGILVNQFGHHVFINLQLCRILGYSREELIGTIMDDLVHPEDLDMVKGNHRRRLSGEDVPDHYELRMLDREGNSIPLEISSSVFDWNGQPATMVVLRDIRWRKKLEMQRDQNRPVLEAMFNNTHMPMAQIDRDFILVMANAAMAAVFGVEPEELIGRSYFDFSPNDARQKTFSDCLATGRTYFEVNKPFRYASSSKTQTSWDWSIVPIVVDGDTVTGLLLTLFDVTERMRTEEQMRKLTRALEQTADAVMITDRQGIVEYVNPGYEKITGYSSDETLGKRPSLLKSGKQGPAFYSQLWETIQAGNVFSEVFVNRRKNGELYFEEKTITPLKNRYSEITHFVATGRDITERMQTQERLHYMAHHDALTELPNRALFIDRLRQALARGRWHNRLVAVLFLDIDRFKNINDSFGHEVGDDLLKELGQRFVAAMREGDTVARFGGDEFVIMATDIATVSDIELIARKLLSVLNDPIRILEKDIVVTASIGISIYPGDGEDSSTLVKHADTAMYRSKELGRNTFQFYSADMSHRVYEHLALENELRNALAANEFELYYQPQFDMSNDRIVAVEALLRWNHPQRGVLLPDEFLPVLEEIGLIVPVTNWVIYDACRQAVAWHDAGLRPLRVAVNISARQCNSMEIVELVTEVLEETGMDPALVELEITESVLMENTSLALRVVNALADIGVRLAIDDFGTGYSSLSYLKRFPVDTLKIDRSFIRDITTDPDDASIIRAIVAMARALNMHIIAEGVETAEQQAFLRQIECDGVQGFLFGTPLPALQIEPLLKDSATVIA
ncbi:MAG: EAL domain-containing protein [Gammaproteobacteria bacterium]|nr:EAL domain-containing protein [Gammaproteobacteria bacterium]